MRASTVLTVSAFLACTGCGPRSPDLEPDAGVPEVEDAGVYVPTDVSARWVSPKGGFFFLVQGDRVWRTFLQNDPPQGWELAPQRFELVDAPTSGVMTLDRIDGGVAIGVKGTVTRWKGAADSVFQFELCRSQKEMDVTVACTGSILSTGKGNADLTVYFGNYFADGGTSACYGTSSDVYERTLSQSPGGTIHVVGRIAETCQLITFTASAGVGPFSSTELRGSAAIDVSVRITAR